MWLAWVTLALAHVPELFVTNAAEDWCRVIDDAQTGDIIMLEPGEYRGPCTIDGNPPDYETEVLTVQAFDLYNPPVFVAGDGDFVLELTGQDVMLSALVFDGTPEGVSAVSVEAFDSTVRFCTFLNTDGTAVEAGKGAARVFVNDNTFFSGGGAAVTVGCADGGCAVEGFEFVDNLLIGVDEGFVVSPGSAGGIRDNILDAVEEGVRLAGADTSTTTIEGNLIRGNAGISVAGGPALIRNNIVVAGATALDVALTETHGVRVLGNTMIGESAMLLAGATSEDEVVTNALQGVVSIEPGPIELGNVTCDAAAANCWVAVEELDLFPATASPLRGAGVMPADGSLAADWCGRGRSDPPSAGAVEAAGELGFGPLAFDFKKAFDCTLAEPTGETGDTGTQASGGTTEPAGTGTSSTTDSAAETDTEERSGDTGVSREKGRSKAPGSACGCSHDGGGGLLWVACIVVAARIRVRPSPRQRERLAHLSR